MITCTHMARSDTRVEAERAAQMLVSNVYLPQAMIRTNPGGGVTDAGHDATKPYKERGFFGACKGLLFPEADRFAYQRYASRRAPTVSAGR